MAGTRTRWTPSQAREVLAELDASGLSQAEFARRRGLRADRLGRWRARFRREAAAHRPALVELVARPSARSGQVQIVCPSGHRVELDCVDLREGLVAALSAAAEAGRC
jgi:hypothetical protein